MTKKKDPKDHKPSGQPTKYREEYCEDIVEYFNSFERYEDVEEVVGLSKYGEPQVKTVRRPLPCPNFYGYAVKLGVCIDTISEWRSKHPRFSAAHKRAKAIQGQFILDSSMQGISPTAFSIFMMKNNFNWTDRVAQDVTQHTTLEHLVGDSFKAEDE